MEYKFFNGNSGEYINSHSTPVRYNFDEDDLTINYDKVTSILDETEDSAERQLTGSGYTITDTIAYYVNVLPYCIVPEGIRLTQKNTMSVRSRRTALPALAKTSPFICTLACGYYHKIGGIYKQRISEADVHKFIKEFRLQSYCTKDINLSNITAIHDQINDFNLIVFNMRGHIIYRRCYEADSAEEENDVDAYITLLWKEDRWLYIKSIPSLFNFVRKGGTKAEFCLQCGYFHLEPTACSAPKPIKTEFQLAKKPSGARHLIGYADFEAYIDKETREHILSGYTVLYTKRRENKARIVASKTTNLLTEDLIGIPSGEASYYLMKLFFEDITAYIEDYNNGINVDVPPICTHESDYHTSRLYVFRSYNDPFKVQILCSYHLKMSEEKLIIYFHNFKGYDSNFIVQFAIANNYDCQVFTRKAAKIDQFLITNIENPYIRFEFRDSFNHLGSPLASLATTIQDWLNVPKRYKDAFAQNKGPFPYHWFDQDEKLAHDIPRAREDWYNELTQGTIKDWDKAIEFFDQNFQHFYEYHDFYNLLDTYILCCVFEQYRSAVLQEDNVDPAYLFGAPSLSLYCAVKQCPEKYVAPATEVLYKLIQKHIRGGVSQVMYRYVDISNKPNDYIKYMDINALYSSCMTERLPINLISFIDGYWNRHESPEYNTDEFVSLFYVDKIVYPEELHDVPVHFQYPLAPHRYQNKLCTTFLDKDKYLIHEDNFYFYESKGLIYDNIIATYVFKQDYVMRDYIINNIKKRNDPSTPKPIKDLQKLKNNSLYGKCCENVWKYKQIKIAQVPQNSSDEEIKQFTRKFKKAREIQYISKNKVIYGENYQRVKLCKPIQLGFAILEKAKLRVYKFIYKLFECYGNRVQLLYTDTDSLIIYFKEFDRDPYYDMQFTMKDYIDVPIGENGEFLPPTKDLGLWSDDSGYKRIIRFCGLRAKSYAVYFADRSETIKNKGIIKWAKIDDDYIKFDHYYKALMKDQRLHATQYIIHRRYRTYILENKCQRKLAINTFDSKHLYAKDKRTAVPFGYKGEKYTELYYMISDFNENKIHI